MRSWRLGFSSFCLTGYVPWSLLETRTTAYLMFRLGAPKSHIRKPGGQISATISSWNTPMNPFLSRADVRHLSLSPIFSQSWLVSLSPPRCGEYYQVCLFWSVFIFSTLGLTANIRIQKKKEKLPFQEAAGNCMKWGILIKKNTIRGEAPNPVSLRSSKSPFSYISCLIWTQRTCSIRKYLLLLFP